jgi:hypothetical protein
MVLQNCYWNDTGLHQDKYDVVKRLIPSMGPVEHPRKNRRLEKLRKAVNCYYDLYNNGLINRANQFRVVFDIQSSHYKLESKHYGRYSQTLYNEVERKIDQIILSAYEEQRHNLVATN